MSDLHHMSFQRFGRSYHLKIKTAGDLEHILELDEAHWVATGAPIKSINCDLTFLSLIDTDNNGRIMCFEVSKAIRWLLDNLQDRSGITDARETLHLDAINTSHDEGKQIHLSAIKVLNQLNLSDSKEITLEQVRKIKSQVEATSISEAGIALTEAVEDPEVKQFIADIIDTTGGTPHSSDSKGVNRDNLDEFLKQTKAYLDWHSKAAIPAGKIKSDIMPLGIRTQEVFELYSSMRDKIDQYFAQCQVVALDERVAKHIVPSDSELESADLRDPQAIEKLMKQSPLAAPRVDQTLYFGEHINSCYALQLDRLRKEVIRPIFDRAVQILSKKDWQTVKRFFAAHEKWVAAKAGAAVEKLGLKKVTAYLDKKFVNSVEHIIEKSNKTALVLENIRLMEKLILYQANILSLVNNFVSFPHLYDSTSRAVFETGTLIMDGRHFNFSVKVENRAEHSSVAKTSNIFILYAEVIMPGNDKRTYEIAVPVTSGGKGNLCVGKRGVFQDLDGNESDARIVQIIENPISLSEAIVSPFQRLGKLLSGKIEAITAKAEKKLDTTASGAIEKAQTGTPPAQGGMQSKGLLAGGLLMGGGVAIAALGSAFAYIGKTLAGVGPLKLVIGVLIAILAVALPISIMALLKLRSRDLSAILEGAGWAINVRMRLTFRQGWMFTRQPRFPKGTRGFHRWCLLLILTCIIAAEAVFLTWYFTRPEPAPQETPSAIQTRKSQSPEAAGAVALEMTTTDKTAKTE